MEESSYLALGSSISKTLPTYDTRNTEAFYTLIIDADNQGFDDVTRYIAIDYCSSISINSTSDITSYPLLTGDILSDHKTDEPITINLECVFSLNGKFKDSFTGYESKMSKLKNIETYFEAVKKYGKTISLIYSSNGYEMFKKRDNLIIKSLTFRPAINSIAISMTLQEVYFFSAIEEIAVSEYVDENLPTYAQFTTLDFTEDVLGDENCYKLIQQTMNDAGLITDEFWSGLLTIVSGGLIDTDANIVESLISCAVLIGNIAIGVAVGVVTKLAIAGTIALASNPIGWVTLAVIGAGILLAGFGWCIYKMINFWKKKALIETFRFYTYTNQMVDESSRYIETIKKCQDAMDEVANDENLKIYGFSSNTNKQDMYLSIDSNTYNFYFEKDSNTLNWTMKVTKIGTTEEEIKLNGSSEMIGKNGILSLETKDALFYTKNFVRVYLVNTALSLLDYDDETLTSFLADEWKKGTITYLNYTEEQLKDTENPPSDLLSRYKQDGLYKDLTKYYLIVTDTEIEKLTDKLKDGIYESLKK